MRARTGFVWGAVLFGLAACGQVNHADGLVQDEDGSPVSAARVQFWCGDAAEPRKTGFTDANGKFNFGIQSDQGRTQRGDLVVWKAGYDQNAVHYHAATAAKPVTIVLKRTN